MNRVDSWSPNRWQTADRDYLRKIGLEGAVFLAAAVSMYAYRHENKDNGTLDSETVYIASVQAMHEEQKEGTIREILKSYIPANHGG